MLTHVLNTALPVFTALFLGVLCRKKNIFTRSGIDTLKKAAVDITLPAVLFSAFATAEYSGKTVFVPVLMFIFCCAALAIGFLMKKLFRQKSILMPFLMTGFEAGMLGYGLFALLYPNEGSSAFAIIDLGQVLFVFTVYKGLLMGRGSARELVRQAFTSPVLWAIIAGLIVGASGLYDVLKPSGISSVVDSVTDFISAPTSCLILLSIGYDLTFKDIPWTRVLEYTAMRASIMVLIFFAAVFVDEAFLGSIIHRGALLLMMMLPAPYVLPVFTDIENERVDISSTLSIMTLLSLVLFSVLVTVSI